MSKHNTPDTNNSSLPVQPEWLMALGSLNDVVADVISPDTATIIIGACVVQEVCVLALTKEKCERVMVNQNHHPDFLFWLIKKNYNIKKEKDD